MAASGARMQLQFVSGFYDSVQIRFKPPFPHVMSGTYIHYADVGMYGQVPLLHYAGPSFFFMYIGTVGIVCLVSRPLKIQNRKEKKKQRPTTTESGPLGILQPGGGSRGSGAHMLPTKIIMRQHARCQDP